MAMNTPTPSESGRKGGQDNTARQALSLLRNQMTGADLRQLSDGDLYQLEAICQHWQAMAQAERKERAGTVNNAFSN